MDISKVKDVHRNYLKKSLMGSAAFLISFVGSGAAQVITDRSISVTPFGPVMTVRRVQVAPKTVLIPFQFNRIVRKRENNLVYETLVNALRVDITKRVVAIMQGPVRNPYLQQNPNQPGPAGNPLILGTPMKFLRTLKVKTLTLEGRTIEVDAEKSFWKASTFHLAVTETNLEGNLKVRFDAGPYESIPELPDHLVVLDAKMQDGEILPTQHIHLTNKRR